MRKFLIKLESTWRREIKYEARYLTSLHCVVGLSEAAIPEVFYKKTVLKKFTISTGNTCVRVLFKKQTPKQVFSCEYCQIFLTLLISEIICERLLFDFYNGSLLHRTKGSRSRLYDGLRLQGLTHRSSFLFLSLCEPSPFRIPLMNQLSFYIGYFWSSHYMV